MSIGYFIVVTLRYSINITYFNNLLIIARIKSSLAFISRSFNNSNLVIKSIIIIYYFLIRALFS
jgi:hypothetical protein